VRHGLATIGEARGLPWLQNHLDYCTTPLLSEPWVLDMDSTVRTSYGHQEAGARAPELCPYRLNNRLGRGNCVRAPSYPTSMQHSLPCVCCRNGRATSPLPPCRLACSAAAASGRPRRSISAPDTASTITALRQIGLSSWCQIRRLPAPDGRSRLDQDGLSGPASPFYPLATSTSTIESASTSVLSGLAPS
jgi:hypothetical protein